MNKVEFKRDHNVFARVGKRIARKLYDAGYYVHLCPSKLYPFGPWHPSIQVSKETQNREFDVVVSTFEQYNCSYEEGYYTTYYVLTEHLEELEKKQKERQ